MFLRRESVSPAPTSGSSETEKKQPRRLTKPKTNKSSSNLRLRALQQMEGKPKSNSTGDLLATSQPVPDQPRALIKSHIFASDLDTRASKSLTSEMPSWKGTAFMVRNIEARHSAEQLPILLSPSKKSRRPLSSIFGNRRTSNTSLKTRSDNSSKDQLTIQPASPLSLTQSSNLTETPEDISPARLQRRSSHAPGVATRQERPEILLEPSDRALDNVREALVEQEDLARPSIDEWQPPPRIARTETPSDLEQGQLGGLRLGSLHVVNGRASPAPSELSRHFIPRMTPAPRRDISSEYAGSEVDDVPTISSVMQSKEHTETSPTAEKLRQRFEATNTPETPRRADNVTVTTPIQEKSPSTPVTSHTPTRFVIPRRKPVASPDRTSVMARAYMAEMPDSPYSTNRPTSPTGSVIVTTTKATEFDDQLFDDETMAPSIYSEAGTVDTYHTTTETGSTRDEVFMSTEQFQRQTSPAKLRPPEQKLADDSGYSSNASLRDDISEDLRLAREARNQSLETLELPRRQDTVQRKAVPQAVRPVSILKQSRATAPELPTFANLQPVSSSASNASSLKDVDRAGPEKSPSKPRKLQKRRPLSRAMPVELITVQGAHHTVDSAIPPVPAEALANLSIRNQEVPELQRTHRSIHHSRNQPSMSDMALAMPDIRFPSPGPNINVQEERSRPISVRRKSFGRRSLSANRNNQQRDLSECSQAEAMAIVNGYGTVVSSLGATPYDAIQTKRPNSASGSHIQIHGARPRPRSMMDDQTAARIARLRSKHAFEQEYQGWNERRPSFNDRGGIPGKSLRPANIASDTPPLPAVPGHSQNTNRNQWLPGQQPSYEGYYSAYQDQRNGDMQPAEDDAPPPPKHSPRPSYVEPVADVENVSLAPPPPSHSPRPFVTDSADGQVDPWAAQALAWKSRRMAANGALQARKSFEEEQRRPLSQYNQDSVSEPLYPAIPERQGHGNHIYQATRSQPYYESPPSEAYQAYHDEQPDRRQLPVPTGNSYWAEQIERPLSRNSQISNAASLAENLHPAEPECPQPPPQFGRYSGGLNYGYEKGAGFGGSAGTRSVSGVNAATRKGVNLRASYGVDLGDVPIIAGLQRVSWKKLNA